MEKTKEKKRKRSRTPESSSSYDNLDPKKKKELKKLKKKLKKERRKEKKLKRKIEEEKKKQKKKVEEPKRDSPDKSDNDDTADIPIDLMVTSKAMAPMTKEEWDKRQSIVREVFDEESGRYRLIKGDGEVLERIVSKAQHKEINQQATKADGEFFQLQTVMKK